MTGIVDIGLALGRRRRAISVVVGLVATALAVLTGASLMLERGALDLRDAVRADRASGRITVVEIDAASIAAFDRWPWPRSIHGQLVTAADRLGAASIAFDVDFSARSTPSEDREFAAALAGSTTTVILPTFRQRAGGGRAGDVESVPLAPFRRNAVLAAVNVRPDGDGLVRRMPLGVVTQGLPRPSLPAMVAGVAGRAETSFPLDYGIDPATIPRISFADLVRGRVPRAMVEGRDLVVGATAIEMGDRYVVPGHGVIPGVVIQALAAETLRRHGVPVELGSMPALVAAGLVLALGIRARRRTLRWAVPGSAIIGLVLLAGLAEAATAVRFAIAPGVILILAGGATFALLGHVVRLVHARLHDAGTGLGNAAALARDATATRQICVATVANHREMAALLGPGRLDELMLRLAERLTAGCGDATIYRIDEGALAWAADWPLDALDDPVHGLHALTRAAFFVGGRPVDISVVFGFAEGEGGAALAANALSAAADAALRGARWSLFNGAGVDEADWQLSILSELDAAMADGSLWVAYQPKLSLATGRIKGAEALVRWQHPTRGPIPPDRFVPAVEARGRMMELTLFVLEQSLADAGRLAAAGHPIDVAVNLSTTLLPNPRLAGTILDVVRRSHCPADRLTLEITESAAIDLSAATIAAIETLRAAGIRISIDDYGTGQSTMSYLKRFPAHELKIDKSFVQSMRTSASDRILVRSTVEMAHELGLSVVAEGVEDAETLAALEACGCDTVQGYLVGRPMGVIELQTMLSARDETRAAA